LKLGQAAVAAMAAACSILFTAGNARAARGADADAARRAVASTSTSASVQSMACPLAGSCTAGGFFLDRAGHQQAFVISERRSTWGKAIEVPGTGDLNAGGNAQVVSVSCTSLSDCAAAGFYTDGSNAVQAFVASEQNGVWARAIEVPGSGVLNVAGNARILSVSCASPGNCGAGGFYTLPLGRVGSQQPFVVSEKHGVWGKAIEVPGFTSANVVEGSVGSVSCASASNCGAAGSFEGSSFRTQAFVVSEQSGHWRGAIEVPGSTALNAGGLAVANSVSCSSAGNCGAGGFYTDRSGHEQAFVVSEMAGHWDRAIEVPGSAALNAGGLAAANSVSCSSAGNCGAGGFYSSRGLAVQAFVVSETNGHWRKAIEVPGTRALNASGRARVNSVSCAPAGDCAAGGSYLDRSGHQQAFVVSERDGTWGKAIEVPGTAALNRGGMAVVNEVSCASLGNCGAGGSYSVSTGRSPAFVVNEKGGTWGKAQTVGF